MRTSRPASGTCVFAAMLRTGAVLLVAASCREVTPVRARPALPVANAIEAQLVASTLTPGLGDSVTVSLRVQSGAALKEIGSFTSRIQYDTTMLKFVSDVSLGGTGMRIANPQATELRVAGIATTGFVGGDLVSLKFVARRASALNGLFANIEEMHTVDRTDVATRLNSRQLVARLQDR